jgi:hypothetical protein
LKIYSAPRNAKETPRIKFTIGLIVEREVLRGKVYLAALYRITNLVYSS